MKSSARPSGYLFSGLTLKFTLAPRKLAYLKSNWLTAVALLLPALRLFRIGRNCAMRALGASVNHRGFGYVVALTIVVKLMGAAGMYTLDIDNFITRVFSNFCIT